MNVPVVTAFRAGEPFAVSAGGRSAAALRVDDGAPPDFPTAVVGSSIPPGAYAGGRADAAGAIVVTDGRSLRRTIWPPSSTDVAMATNATSAARRRRRRILRVAGVIVPGAAVVSIRTSPSGGGRMIVVSCVSTG